MRRPFRVIVAAVLTLVVSGWADVSHVWAQGQSRPDLSSLLGDSGGAPNPKSVVKVSAVLRPASDSRKGELAVTAKIANGWHIYSITQAPGGPVRSKIKLDKSSDYA